MEATLHADSVPQTPPAPAPAAPKFGRKYWALIFWTLLFIGLNLGTVVLDYYVAQGRLNLPKNEILTFQATALALLLMNFGLIMCHVIGKLKKNEAIVQQQAQDTEENRTELHFVHTKLDNAQADLRHAKSQLKNTLFQLNNANLQFDIITSELDAAKRETDAIFANVRQGLFLLSPDGTIGAQTSVELKAIFQTSELARRSFMNVLRPLLPEKRHKTISDYFDILFDPRKNDKQLQKFNPLKRVELNFTSPDGGFQPKHIEFSFQRIMADGAVTRVMVTVLDITERVRLEEQLRAGEMMREKQLELLFEILQVESVTLRRFIESAETGITQINTIFMEPGASTGAQLQDKVNRVFRIAHNLKSDAAAHGLLLFEKTVHQIEDQLTELRRNPAIVNEDLLNVLVFIANFQTQLREASTLIEKISSLHHSFAPAEAAAPNDREFINGIAPAANSVTELKQSVEDLCRTVTERRGKMARIEWNLDGYDDLPPNHRRLLKNAIFQLVRNSLVHGIELPEDRAKEGKDPCGCVTVAIAKMPESDQVRITCRDDGAGLDVHGIREHAKREGLIKEVDDKELTEQDIFTLIFEPGFSTAGAVSEDAGRGVGLDVVREEIVDQLHGEIHIEFAAREFCEFGITVPAV